MREYSHNEFVEIVNNLSEKELLELSANYGGYPVLFRMALDEKINHKPFIQNGAAIIIRNEEKQILLQKRANINKWGVPGGCQELGETLSGNSGKNSYPNGDIVYNNNSLYLADVTDEMIFNLKCNSETNELKFFNIEGIPKDVIDEDLINTYVNRKS